MLLQTQTFLHPVNFILISGLSQCLIVAGILFFFNKGNRKANRLFGIFILVSGLHFSWPLIMDTNLEGIFLQILWFPYSYILALGPLLFFYTKSLAENGFKIKGRDFIHFLPVSLELLIQMYFIRESIKSHEPIYNVSGFLMLRIAESAGAAISILVYSGRCLALVKIHEAWLLQNFSNQKNITLSWLLNLIRYLKVVWVIWLAFEMSFLVFWRFQIHLIPVYILIYILLGVIIYSTYWIGVQGLIKSEVLAENTVSKAEPEESTTVYARLSAVELKNVAEALQHAMQTEKLYLYETLSLRTLASRLQMEPNLVSYILNNTLHKSFYDFVNEYRIEEVKRKIEDPAYGHFKIVEIAYECGFNSKATFNRVFKKFTGKSPKEHREKVY
jgi:AraC-like DNA-binding protein